MSHGFTDFPPASGTAGLNLWPLINQARLAVTERHWLAGNRDWPRGGYVFRRGTVTAATETSLTTDDTWHGGTDDVSGNTYTDPWNDIQSFLYGVPTSWDVYVNDNDPEKVVRAQIQSWTNTGVLTISNIRDYVTSGQIPSVASLAGKEFVIIGRGKAVWNERLMEWPNATTHASGTVREYNEDPAHPSTVTSPTHSSIKDDDTDNVRWAPGDLVGLDLLLYADDGFLKRVTITDDANRTLTFAAQSWTPVTDSPYVVVKAGGRAIPGRTFANAFQWYRGAREDYVTHGVDDAIGDAPKPQKQVFVPGAGGGGCDGEQHPVWEEDFWTDYPVSPDDVACGGYPADTPYALDIWKTWRGMQKGLEDAVNTLRYVERKDYAGEKRIPIMPLAQAFYNAGINAWATSVSAQTGSTFTTGAPPASPFGGWRCYWSIADTLGEHYKSGTGFITSAGEVNPTGIVTFDADDVGNTAYVSLGWSEYQPREHRRMFDDACLIPDTVMNAAVLPIGIQNPGTADPTGLGTWEMRPASTTYIERRHHDNFWDEPEGFNDDGTETFVVGELSRHRGDYFMGPATMTTANVPIKSADTDDGLRPYWDHFAVVTPDTASRHRLSAQLTGRAESGSRTWLTDTTKDWFDFATFAGVAYTEAGTFTGGSATSGTDTTKASGTGDLNFPWATARWTGGFTGPYEGFVVEVLISGSDFDLDDSIVEKRLITSSSATAVSLTWGVALSTSASGKKYRIFEPWKANRYKGRRLTIVSGDRTAQTVIRGNDATTLFFDEIPFGVDPSCSFSIDDPPIGQVYQWAGGGAEYNGWVKPVGADVARTTVPVPADFHADLSENLPTYVKRYGRLMAADMIGRHLFTEFRAFCNVTTRVKGTVGWDGKSGPLAALEWNTRFADGRGPTFSYSDAKDLALTHWTEDLTDNSGATSDPDGIPDSEAKTAGRPYAYAQCDDDEFAGPPPTGCHTYTIGRRFAYPYVTDVNPAARQTYGVTAYAKADVWPANADPDYAPAYNDGDACPAKYVFDTNGDGFQYRVFEPVASFTASNNDIQYGPKIGTIDEPNETGDPLPAGVTAFCSLRRGYEVYDEAAVVQGDVDGGLVYWE